MTVVVAYADTPPGQRAVATAATGEWAHADERVVLVPAVRGEQCPDVAEVERRWPALAGRVEVVRGDVGDPGDAVVQVAQRHDARMVVLGLRHRSAVGKLVFGSTAQRILLGATCPVLTVKPDGAPGA